MKTMTHRICTLWPLLALAALPGVSAAQVAVPEVEEIEEYPVLLASELEELVGPIALYPDDLLAIVLPATTFPLQVVEAGRFLEDLEDDPSLKPDDDWDDSIVALLNYPEVVAMLNEDLDWTWRLGEAVVNQQSDVIAAIEGFRDRAYAAGNLKSDDYQLVAEDEGAISITPVQEDVIYVPYYEPEQVVVYQPRPVYYYYPRAYPVYYYPYPSWYAFNDHFYYPWFWGVTTAFSIGWHSHHVSVFHQSYWGHPYYGHTYWDRWWYRRPDIHIYNNTYVVRNTNVNINRYRDGDYWAPGDRRTVRGDQRITRTRYYPGSNGSTPASVRSTGSTSTNRAGQVARSTAPSKTERYSPPSSERERFEFRERPSDFAASTTRPSQATRPSQPRVSTSRPTQPGVTTTRPSPSGSATSRPAEPRTLAPAAPSRSAPSTSTRQPAVRPSTPQSPTVTRPSSSSRQPVMRPSTPSRQPVSRPSTPSPQPVSRPSTPSRQPVSRPSSSSRQPVSRPSASSRPSTASRASGAAASRSSSSSRSSSASNKRAQSRDK